MSAPLLEALRQQVADAPPAVVALYVFGSVARGTSQEASDIDLGVLLRPEQPRTLDRLLLAYQDQLTGILSRRVQFAILNDAAPDFVHRVMRDGVVVLDRDRAARLRFEVRARNLYFDLLPYLERYRRQVLARATRR